MIPGLSRQEVTMSKEEVEWLKQTLKDNREKPTLIFFHGPLPGTYTDDDFGNNPRHSAEEYERHAPASCQVAFAGAYPTIKKRTKYNSKVQGGETNGTR